MKSKPLTKKKTIKITELDAFLNCMKSFESYSFQSWYVMVNTISKGLRRFGTKTKIHSIKVQLVRSKKILAVYYSLEEFEKSVDAPWVGNERGCSNRFKVIIVCE